MAIIGVPECKNCIGLDKCNKYCTKMAGRNLADFMVSIDTCETAIGEMRKPHTIGSSTLIVTGHQLGGGGVAPTYILRELTSSIKINSDGKFRHFMGKNIIGVLKSYTDTIDQEVYKGRIEHVNTLIKGFNSNRVLAVPFKLGTDVIITVKDAQNRDKRLDGTISSLIWKTNQETGKLEGKAVVKYNNPMSGSKLELIPFTEYGTRMTLANLERKLKTSEIQPEFISMINEGFIRPIIISDGNIVIAVDCKNMYLISDNSTIIVGAWSDKGMMELVNLDSIKKTKAYTKLNSAIRYIEGHRRFIAPLGLVEENKIQL